MLVVCELFSFVLERCLWSVSCFAIWVKTVTGIMKWERIKYISKFMSSFVCFGFVSTHFSIPHLIRSDFHFFISFWKILCPICTIDQFFGTLIFDVTINLIVFAPQYFYITHHFVHTIVFQIWTLNLWYYVITMGMECESAVRKELSYLTAVSKHSNPILALHALRTIRRLRSRTPNPPHFNFNLKMLKNGESEKINEN